ncbi:biotin/lipoate--protein ligase family protein [Salaquimonas pukyongi]|uniref:biotin/lipoate--protein ligase family protein n=1 Tax=Salaquimonas pukyongi TaxID=2712698 RepID=UPI00096B9508|nr:biotin/lipoate--protein ligase family protein [Salaquimonas pukyongi]
MSEPTFPPLFAGEALAGRADPFERARAQAIAGCDPGTVIYNISDQALHAALILGPEVALEDAMAMMPACGVGFQNALGSLAPPEVAVHLEWDGKIRVNGAQCGMLKACASTQEGAAIPDWLVIGLQLDLLFESDAPGEDPDRTALYEEGCADVEATQLLEAWVRHTLYWISRWSEEGVRPLHVAWRELAHEMGEPAEFCGVSGVFVGVDEQFGALLRDGETTHLVALSRLLEN